MFKNEDMGAYYQYYGTGSMIHPHGNLIQSNLFQRVGNQFQRERGGPAQLLSAGHLPGRAVLQHRDRG